MQSTLSKLMLVGFGIIVMSFMIITNGHAQSSLDPNAMPSRTTIQSKEDYKVVENLIDDLADKIYMINQQYPDFTYQHHYNEDLNKMTVSISGIEDQALLNKISLYLIKLEKLGEAVREMDAKHLPDAREMKESDRMNEEQVRRYVPKRSATKK